jgi:hypothetical protein
MRSLAMFKSLAVYGWDSQCSLGILSCRSQGGNEGGYLCKGTPAVVLEDFLYQVMPVPFRPESLQYNPIISQSWPQ